MASGQTRSISDTHSENIEESFQWDISIPLLCLGSLDVNEDICWADLCDFKSLCVSLSLLEAFTPLREGQERVSRHQFRPYFNHQTLQSCF